MPELRQLRVLRAVGELGSFSIAADKLGYTQPAISKIVASLELEIGTQLVDRGTRPLRLTDAGEALSRRAASAFEQLAAARLEVDAIAGLGGGSLRVATFSSAGSAMVADALRAFRADHPHVALEFSEISMPSALLRALRAGDIHLGITFDYPETSADIGEGLELHHLLADPFDLIVPRTHRLARRRHVSVADLAGENWLLPDFGPDSPSLRMINRRCSDAGFEPRVVFRINDCQMTQSMVAAGFGVALLPRLMLRFGHPDVAIKPLDRDPPIRRICALRLPTRFLTPATERFLALLVAASAGYEGAGACR
jgi:DNA-binding transcriptional LysR family regulator